MSDQGRKLADRINAIPKAVREAVKPALEESGDELAARMKALAPVDTGALKGSIAVTLPGETTPVYSQPGGERVARDNEVLVTAGNEKVRYAHFVEYGTSHSHAEPFFWPAYRLMKARIESRLSGAISSAVKSKWGKP